MRYLVIIVLIFSLFSCGGRQTERSHKVEIEKQAPPKMEKHNLL